MVTTVVRWLNLVFLGTNVVLFFHWAFRGDMLMAVFTAGVATVNWIAFTEGLRHDRGRSGP